MTRSDARRIELDPNATLTEIRALLANGEIGNRYAEESCEQSGRLAELIEALDLWIMKGGCLPKEWAQAYAQAVAEKEV